MANVAPTLTSLSKNDLERLFASSDDEDAGPSIIPDIDRAQVTRDATRKARESLNMPDAASAPAEAGASNSQGPTGEKRRREDEGEEGPKRRVMAKIDAERLLGDYGFPALVQQTKNFKPKGKGHEKEDLDRVMTLYQLWAHRMFPKRRFIDTVERVEKVCRERRMLVALGVWRDALNPNKPQKKDPVSEADIILSDEEGAAEYRPSASGGRAEGIEKTGPTSFEKTGEGDSDDEEIWAEIFSRMKGNNNAPPAVTVAPAAAAGGPAPSKTQDQLFAEDEDALWDDMMREEEAQNAQKASEPAKSVAHEEDEDALWDEMMREQEQEEVTTAKKQPVPIESVANDEEEDMMALMREADEQETAAESISLKKVAEPAGLAQGLDTPAAVAPIVDDDDWERLYD